MTIFASADNQWFVSLITSNYLLKVAVFFIAWAALWLPLAIPIATFLKWHPSRPLTVEQKLPLLASLYLIAPLILWGVAWLENNNFSAYGLEWKIKVLESLLLGITVGIFSLAVVFICQWVVGWVEWNFNNWQRLRRIFLPLLLLCLWISITEELIFRGFLLNEFSQGIILANSYWLAGAISSLIFALAHLVWEQKNTLPQLPGLWLMGMVLVLARWLDNGSLGLAWGLHVGLIWGFACLEDAKLISYTGKGSIWMTGWGGNPLAGVTGCFFLLGVGLLLLLLSDYFVFLTF
ncbi:MAG: CPBP family intramembrane glutamic endopeptidase [Coleofasciculaceae cyanobacterium]